MKLRSLWALAIAGAYGVAVPGHAAEVLRLEDVVARALGKTPAWVSSRLALLNLTDTERGDLREDHPLATVILRQTPMRRALYVSVLLHDIAKSETRVESPDGRIGFPGHDSRGGRSRSVAMAISGMNSTMKPALIRPRKSSTQPERRASARAMLSADISGCSAWTRSTTFPTIVDMTATVYVGQRGATREAEA